MARQIKETPILFGKHAEHFYKEIENIKPASKREREASRKNYELAKSRAVGDCPLF